MIITQTPLRLSFFGGGTDFREFFSRSGGAVLAMALDKYVYVIVKERFDRDIYLNYSRKEIVSSRDEIEHELVREAMRTTGVVDGIEVTTLADIPSEGSGLGSSSSVTVGLLNAFHTYRGEQVPLERLARQACEIEIDTLGKPIGVQDQYTAATGGLRFIEFRESGEVRVERVDIDDDCRRELVSRVLLYFTGTTRKSKGVLEEQRANIEARLEQLSRLRDMAYRARELLVRGELDEFGRLLDAGWALKKQLASRVSNPVIDEMYARARSAGALGGKILGAGAGGFLMLFCPAEGRDAIRHAMADYRELPVRMGLDGSKVIFNMARYL